jgi:hypothetical protein
MASASSNPTLAQAMINTIDVTHDEGKWSNITYYNKKELALNIISCANMCIVYIFVEI